MSEKRKSKTPLPAALVRSTTSIRAIRADDPNLFRASSMNYLFAQSSRRIQRGAHPAVLALRAKKAKEAKEQATEEETEEQRLEHIRKREWGFFVEDFNEEFFSKVAKSLNAKLVSFKSADEQIDSSTGIMSSVKVDGKFTEKDVLPLNGFFTFSVVLQSLDDGKEFTQSVVVKIKPADWTEAQTAMISMFNDLSPEIAALDDEMKIHFMFGTETRDGELFDNLKDERFTSIVPKVFVNIHDKNKHQYVLATEDITRTSELLNSTDEATTLWTESDINVAIRDIAKFHSIYYEKSEKVGEVVSSFFGPKVSFYGRENIKEGYRMYVKHMLAIRGEFFSETQQKLFVALVESCEKWIAEIESYEKDMTLVHGDFGPRNSCLRTGREKLCAFDWELAHVNLPQFDIADVIMFFGGSSDSDSRGGWDVQKIEEVFRLHREVVTSSATTTTTPTSFETWLRQGRLSCMYWILWRGILMANLCDPNSAKFMIPLMRTFARVLETFCAPTMPEYFGEQD